MKLLFFLHHPAHFHLFRNTIDGLRDRGNEIIIVSVKKDILERLLEEEGLEHINVLPRGRGGSRPAMALALLLMDLRLLKICLSRKPDLLIGTSTEITHVGGLLSIPNIMINEDDVEAVPLVGHLAYRFARHILTPEGCGVGEWEKKTLRYPGFHELAYLHPDHFKADIGKLSGVMDADSPYFIIRFAKLTAHHDEGKKGISTELARKIIDKLSPHGRIYISSERPLEREFETYGIAINPMHIHHVLYFAQLYIGDSQTMAAEAAVLGTPSLRFNDFVGRLAYLEELEHEYGLTYGVKTSEPDRLLEKIDDILAMEDRKDVWKQRREKMLRDKINVAEFFIWLFENYPGSVEMIRDDPSFPSTFNQARPGRFSAPTRTREICG